MAILLLTALGNLAGHVTIDGQAEQKDQELLRGTWVVTKMESEGKDHPITAPMKWIWQGRKITNVREEKKTTEGMFQLDPSKKPRLSDIQITFAADDEKIKGEKYKFKGQVIKGIYSLEGDYLELALGSSGGERLEKFSSEGKGKRILYLKRSK